MTTKITVTSDFICPWCLIGESRLHAAIESLPEDVEVEVAWRPFELNPDMPKEGMDRKTYRSAKFGGWERSQALDAHTVEAAGTDPVEFDYAAIQRTPNTFQAHRLSWFADRHGLGTAMRRAILSAYFEHGRDIGDDGVLAAIAGEVGLDPVTATAFLAGTDGDDIVRRQIRDSAATGVPHFVIGGIPVSGARTTRVLRNAILDAHARAANIEKEDPA